MSVCVRVGGVGAAVGVGGGCVARHTIVACYGTHCAVTFKLADISTASVCQYLRVLCATSSQCRKCTGSGGHLRQSPCSSLWSTVGTGVVTLLAMSGVSCRSANAALSSHPPRQVHSESHAPGPPTPPLDELLPSAVYATRAAAGWTELCCHIRYRFADCFAAGAALLL